MKKRQFCGWLVTAAPAMVVAGTTAFGLPASAAPGGLRLHFLGVDYEHRWSKNGQNEFTPREQTDLTSWRDMLTINVHEAVASEAQLKLLAHAVLGNYQQAGKVLYTGTRPASAGQPTEYQIVALLGNAELLEAVFARFLLSDGVGTVVVYSHRVYGSASGPAMNEWLQAHGTQVETALMTWDRLPAVAALSALPQSH
ncbi:MAG: hypothetical protein WCZ20_14095 [Hydrogenophaga sp.]